MSQYFSSNEERGLSALVHIVPMVATSLLLNLVFPIIILCISDSPFVRQHAKESLNFQITVWIWALISLACCFILIGFVMFVILAFAAIVLPIIATVKAFNGEDYRYPLTFRFIK